MNLKVLKTRFLAQPELSIIQLVRLIVLVSLLVLLATTLVYLYGHIPELQAEKITAGQSLPQVSASQFNNVTGAAESKRTAPPIPATPIRDPFNK